MRAVLSADRADGTRTDRRPYGVFDVETDGLRGPLLYWTAACECRPDDVTTGTTAAALYGHLTAHSGRQHANRDHVWWAHNGGEYDDLYLIDPIRRAVFADRMVASPVTRDTTTIGWRLTTGRNRTDLRDSYALLPSSLRALTASLAPDLAKLDIGLADGVTFDPEDPAHRAYAERDTRGLLAVLLRFRAVLGERFGTLPSWSAAATALRAWQRTLRPGEAYRPLAGFAVPLARAGYAGGLVHLGSTEPLVDATTLDVNAMYPTVMAEAGVPAGAPWPVRGWDNRHPGIFACVVTVPPDQPFTFLPYRTAAGLAWPTGTFPCVLTSPEIRAAVGRGIRVRVDRGIVWPTIVHPFASYVERIAAMRAEGGAMATVGKLLGNGLYGKFGSRPLRDEWRLSAERPGPDWSPPPFDATDDAEVAAHAGLWVRSDVPLRAAYLLPHWAAWITAGARLRLLDLVEAVGDVVYTDTDSVTAPRAAVERAIAAGRVRVGSAFGDVKVEREWSRFQALGPKVVRGVLVDGTPIYKAKGIPRRQVAAAFDPGRPAVEWDSPNASLRILRGAGMLTPRSRRLSSLDHSIAWRMTDAGVRPIDVDDRPT